MPTAVSPIFVPEEKTMDEIFSMLEKRTSFSCTQIREIIRKCEDFGNPEALIWDFLQGKIKENPSYYQLSFVEQLKYLGLSSSVADSPSQRMDISDDMECADLVLRELLLVAYDQIIQEAGEATVTSTYTASFQMSSSDL